MLLNINIARYLLTISMALFAVFNAVQASEQVDRLSFARDGRELPVLVSGWYINEPYEFISNEFSGGLTGIDIMVVREIANRMGLFVDYEYLSWANQVKGVREGTLDFTAAASPSQSRREFAHFSIPYRTEEIVLLTSQELQQSLSGFSTKQIVTYFSSNQLRLGIVEGVLYGMPDLDAYVTGQAGTDLVVPVENNTISLWNLRDGEIDGFLVDRLTAVDIMAKNSAFHDVFEVPVGGSSDISLMFSRANIPEETIEEVNAAIAGMKSEGVISEIQKRFLVPLYFNQTTGSAWYWLVDMIGTIAFAASGVILGCRIRTNIAGFFVLSALPAIGGGIMRDVLLDRDVSALYSVQYVVAILAVSSIGYLGFRIQSRNNQEFKVTPLFARLFNVFDAVGLGSFTVTGIAVTISDPHQHSVFWAPFVGVLTATGGGLLRDTLVQRHLNVLFDDLYMQISLFWGVLLTAYVVFTPVRIIPNQYAYVMWGTVTMIVLTRVGWLYHKDRLSNF